MSDQKTVYSGHKGCRSSSGRANRAKRGKRPLNRYVLETSSNERFSASSKKVDLDKDIDDIDVDGSFGYRFINLIPFLMLLSQLVVCKKCHSNVVFEEKSRRGLGFKIAVKCNKCKVEEINSSPIVRGNAYDINYRLVLVMRLLGIGLHGIEKFCAVMELPCPIFHSCYDKFCKIIDTCVAAVCENSIKNAVFEEKQMSEENGMLDGITVSGDGSWRKRGFSSLFGVTTLIGWFTGKVVDLIIKSKFCKSCEYWSKKEGTAEHEEWMAEHQNVCGSNHEGSAGKMEVDSVIEMFSRSEALHDVRYCNYIGDGDSKTYKGIKDAQPYPDFTVQKKECVGHVQKRMGSRLRNLKKNVKGLGGRGKLTGKLIDELSIYYGLAIRRNHDSIENMRRDIFATLFHKISTDKKPRHENCPVGKDSWCSWQKAKACGELKSYEHKPPMDKAVYNAVLPTYEELSSDDLLHRCLGGFTQNSNESFNSTIWALASKTSSGGNIILQIAAHMAACIFNDGMSSILKILDALGLPIGSESCNFARKRDELRVQLAERSLTEGTKKARREAQTTRKAADIDDMDVEGLLYGPGIAD